MPHLQVTFPTDLLNDDIEVHLDAVVVKHNLTYAVCSSPKAGLHRERFGFDKPATEIEECAQDVRALVEEQEWPNVEVQVVG